MTPAITTCYAPPCTHLAAFRSATPIFLLPLPFRACVLLPM